MSEKTFQFDLVSPEKILLSEQVRMVEVPGEEGDFGVLADHAPVLSSVRPGIVTVTAADGVKTRFFVSGGFADVSGNICALLAEEAVNVAELDKAALEQQLVNLKDDLGFANDSLKQSTVRRNIAITEAKLRAVA